MSRVQLICTQIKSNHDKDYTSLLVGKVFKLTCAMGDEVNWDTRFVVFTRYAIYYKFDESVFAASRKPFVSSKSLHKRLKCSTLPWFEQVWPSPNS